MTLRVGDRIPSVTVHRLDGGVQAVDTAAFFAGHRQLLFAVPGAFTPTCTSRHLPSYAAHMTAFERRGIAVACVAVNDVYVLDAWARAQGVPENLAMLADGNADFVGALGLAQDRRAYGMGLRARRFALLADDGRVELLHVEAPGEYRVSSAEAMLAAIDEGSIG